MEQIQNILDNALDALKSISDSILKNVTSIQLLLALLVLVIVLLVLIAVKSRRYEDAMLQLDEQSEAAQQTIEQKTRELQEQQDKLMGQVDEREKQSMDMIAGKERTFDEKNEELFRLRRFYEEHKDVGDSKAEAQALLREANDYVAELKDRTNREYAEIIGHANKEAEIIRGMSQGMLSRSHDTLIKALDRAKQIMDEARSQSGMPIKEVPESVEQAMRELAQLEDPMPDDGLDRGTQA